jgi:hypothetical protein
MEHRFGSPDVATYEYHEHRERAPHWEQSAHRRRLEVALDLVHEAARLTMDAAVVDLGCGDGGLLAQLSIPAWGYDFAPANVGGWAERGVNAELLDVFNHPGFIHPDVRWAPIVVLTEVLEHINMPHSVLRVASRRAMYAVASSPIGEVPDNHIDCHQWGWDEFGYAQMFREAGWDIVRQIRVDWSQVVLARSAHG